MTASPAGAPPAHPAPEIARAKRYERMVETAASLAQAALEAVCGDRNASYGHPADNHAATAQAWQAYLDNRPSGPPIDGTDVCMLNMLQKCIRNAHARRRDNLTDIIGYALNAEIVEEDRRGEAS